MTKENELIPFTFESSGETVMLRRISPLLPVEVQRSYPPPLPPSQEVDYGDGVKRLETNPAHPDYQRALDQYRADLEQKIRRMVIKLGVVVTWTDERRADLQTIRDFWQEEFNARLDPSDEVAWVSFCAIKAENDLEMLLNAIMRRSQPTEAAIAEMQAGFRG